MSIRKTAAYEWFDSIGKPVLGTALILSFIGLAVTALVYPTYKKQSVAIELERKLNTTGAGRFALVQLRECQTGGGTFSERSEVDCVRPVIEAARLLKGEPFAHDVSQSLAMWIDRRSSLDF